MDLVLLIVAILVGLAALTVALRAVLVWRGPRRMCAILVLLGALGWSASIAWGIHRDPTSHNLWPIESVVVAAATLTALVAMSSIGRRRMS